MLGPCSLQCLGQLPGTCALNACQRKIEITIIIIRFSFWVIILIGKKLQNSKRVLTHWFKG
jgi:hypothetical protein